MKSISMTLAIGALLVAGACSKQQHDTATTAASTDKAPAVATQQHAELTPEELGELGAQIKKNPDDAHRLLTQHGLDEDTFAHQVRKVSEDPAASQRYAESYKKAGA